MIDIGVRFPQSVRAAKAGFFDRAAVQQAMSVATRRVFSAFGAFVRERAKGSIRPAAQKTLAELTKEERQQYHIAKSYVERGGPRARKPLRHSRPGEPPRSITGLLRRFIFFALDRKRESVVIGPARLASTSGNVPEVLEYGGWTTSRRLGRRVHIAARPYMWPAFEHEEPKLAALWANSVRPKR